MAILRLLWRTIMKFFGDGCSSMAAALSFYTFFSLPALLTLLLMLVGTITDPRQVQDAITGQIGGLIGQAGADQVATIIENANRTDINVTLATVLGLLALAFGATTAFAQLQSALNQVWQVKPDPRRGDIRNFFVKRVFSFGVVLAIAFLLLVSLAASAILSALGQRLTTWLGAPELVLQTLAFLLSFVVVAALFAVMYKYLPDARITWRDAGVGAFATALLFVGGKTVIGAYLGASDPGSAYGAAGSLALILIWVYYSSMIVLFGAEFTYVWAEKEGRGVVPEKGAVAVVQEERRVAEG